MRCVSQKVATTSMAPDSSAMLARASTIIAPSSMTTMRSSSSSSSVPNNSTRVRAIAASVPMSVRSESKRPPDAGADGSMSYIGAPALNAG
jgi:hypothetical protein